VVSTLEERITGLEQENRGLLQNKYKNETALQDMTSKLKHCEDDMRILQQEITLTKKQNEKLDQDYHEKQRLTTNLQNRVSSLEIDVKEKQTVLQRQHDQVMQLSEQKKFLEEHATAVVKEVEKVKSVNKMVSSELMKANEIIKKLQDDIRNLNSKCKLQVAEDSNI
jgi:spindle assembly abnormal protein 6